MGTPYPIAEGVTMYFSYDVVTSNTGGNGFRSGKNELFPIPAPELNNNPKLQQSPGW